MLFMDRADAGRRLAQDLAALSLPSPVVMALPRGGVPVAFEVARALQAPLDLVLVRKIGAPGFEEYGIGAIVDGPQPVLWLDKSVVAHLQIPKSWIEQQEKRQLAEIERRRKLWLQGRPPVPVEGRTAIVIDDGVATGGTMRAALRSLRRRNPSRLIMAVPVAAPDTLAALSAVADQCICLHSPGGFHAVGTYYQDFHQLDDAEVTALLNKADGSAPPAPG